MLPDDGQADRVRRLSISMDLCTCMCTKVMKDMEQVMAMVAAVWHKCDCVILGTNNAVRCESVD